jgi:hypothetical protein
LGTHFSRAGLEKRQLVRHPLSLWFSALRLVVACELVVLLLARTHVTLASYHGEKWGWQTDSKLSEI